MKSHRTLVRLILCAVFAAVLCICSPLSIPVGPIPMTLSVFAVMLCGVVLDLPCALGSVLVYLTLGLFLPVFSGGNTGLSALPGPTGGYIWSYLLMIPVIRVFAGLRVRSRFWAYTSAFCGCVVSLCVCYLCGCLQFSLLAGRSLREAAAVCVAPFVGVDLGKALAASLLGVPLREILRRNRILKS